MNEWKHANLVRGGTEWMARLRAPLDAFRWTFFIRSPRDEPTADPTRRSPKMARLEAALFVADGALSARRLAQVATLAGAREVHTLIEQLNRAYEVAESSFRVERVASGFQLLTRSVFARWLGRIHDRQAQLKLSPPAMETLTLVAYLQPTTRADVEAVRGVQCAEMLKQLMERGLVRIAGEDDSLGRPFLYETTREFLELFGLGSLDDLPGASRLRRLKKAPKKSSPEPPEDGDAPGESGQP